MKFIGEQIWDMLRAEGGFVWTMADGRQFVRFNPGCHPSPALVKILRNQREVLKAYVDERHAEMDRLGWSRSAPRGIGSSGCIESPARKRRGGGICDCNGIARSNSPIKAAIEAPQIRDYCATATDGSGNALEKCGDGVDLEGGNFAEFTVNMERGETRPSTAKTKQEVK